MLLCEAEWVRFVLDEVKAWRCKDVEDFERRERPKFFKDVVDPWLLTELLLFIDCDEPLFRLEL